jgi:hypothetical protein
VKFAELVVEDCIVNGLKGIAVVVDGTIAGDWVACNTLRVAESMVTRCELLCA